MIADSSECNKNTITPTVAMIVIVTIAEVGYFITVGIISVCKYFPFMEGEHLGIRGSFENYVIFK